MYFYVLNCRISWGSNYIYTHPRGRALRKFTFEDSFCVCPRWTLKVSVKWEFSGGRKKRAVSWALRYTCQISRQLQYIYAWAIPLPIELRCIHLVKFDFQSSCHTSWLWLQQTIWASTGEALEILSIEMGWRAMKYFVPFDGAFAVLALSGNAMLSGV